MNERQSARSSNSLTRMVVRWWWSSCLRWWCSRSGDGGCCCCCFIYIYGIKQQIDKYAIPFTNVTAVALVKGKMSVCGLNIGRFAAYIPTESSQVQTSPVKR